MKNLKKQQIINVSIDLFAEKGVESVSVANIANCVGLSRPGLYHHFSGGKQEIIHTILLLFEDCVKRNIPNPKEWEDKNANPTDILSRLFFKFEESEALKLRKITRIIVSGMHHDPQIKQYAEDYFIVGRERLLASCFKALADNGLIPPLYDPERAARILNSILLRCAMIDSTNYPYGKEIDESLFSIMSGDCENCFEYLLTGNKPF